MTEIDQVLERREKLYETLLRYSRQQEGLSYLQDAAAYRGLVELKDQCITELMKNETLLKQLIQKVGEKGKDDARMRLEAWNQKMAPVTREIKSYDRQCRTKFAVEMQTVREQLNTINRGKKGIVGYQAANRAVGAAGAYTDKRS